MLKSIVTEFQLPPIITAPCLMKNHGSDTIILVSEFTNDDILQATVVRCPQGIYKLGEIIKVHKSHYSHFPGAITLGENL